MTTKITRENIVSTALTTFDGPAITSVSYVGVNTVAAPAGGETLTINGRAFSPGANVFIDNTSCSTTFVNSTTLTFTSPSKNAGSYFLYVYNTDGSFAIKPNGIVYASPILSSVEYLVVAGGGAGGNGAGGGGGGGGYRTSTNFAISQGTPYTVTVGGGGTTADTFGANGTNSVFSTISASGGGGGGTYSATPANRHGRSGGSGGGGGGYVSAGDQTIGQSGPGNLGGYSPAEGFAGGTGATFGAGGGGAGAVGSNGTTVGNGGDGRYSLITGANVAYAGGGGGSGDGTPGGNGGAGGGGLGQSSSGGRPGVNGTPNTGGGGGGGGGQSGVGQFGQGGSGIVIIKYPDTYANATVTGSPNVIYANANIIYRFWQSGTITFT